MRAIIIGGIVTLAVFSTAAYASPGAKFRSPEVILMTSSRLEQTAGRDPVASIEAKQRSGPVRSDMVVPFQTHDLSRQWVRFEMSNGLATELAPDSPDADAIPLTIPSAPSIAIPQWMRSGTTFSSPATSLAVGCNAETYRPSGFLDAATEVRRFNHYRLMGEIACHYGIPVGLFDALIIRESRYNPAIFSSKNAYGLTQLMPETAASLNVDRYDAEQNLRGGARYLRQQLDRFGHVHLALAAYNAGPGRVRNGLIPRIAETQAYVANVLTNWQRLANLYRAPPVRTQATALARRATISAF